MSVPGIVYNEVKRLIEERKRSTLAKLIAEHNAGGLNDGKMRGIVGELAALTYLLDDAERKMKARRTGEEEE